jgi:P-type E1-E2 ATPase
VKDAIEDYQRHVGDALENKRPTARVIAGDLAGASPIEARQACVGDVLLVKNRELIPADLVVLASSEGQNCSVMTANLDGETNLKIREVRDAVFW